MKAFHTNIEKDTKANSFFRKVIFTGHLQLVLMSLLPGEDIGKEVHHTVDQFFRFEEGEGKVVAAGEEFTVGPDDVVVIPAGTEHNITNTGRSALKIYTIYAPANHSPNKIHKTKAEAMADEEDEHHEGGN